MGAPLRIPKEPRLANKPHTLSKRVALAKSRRHIGIHKLAKTANVSISVVHKIMHAKETHDPSVWTIARLAIALGVSIDYLVGITDYNGIQTEEAVALGGAGYLSSY